MILDVYKRQVLYTRFQELAKANPEEEKMPEIQERFHWVKILCIVLWEEPISADQIPTAWNITMSKQMLIHKMGRMFEIVKTVILERLGIR